MNRSLEDGLMESFHPFCLFRRDIDNRLINQQFSYLFSGHPLWQVALIYYNDDHFFFQNPGKTPVIICNRLASVQDEEGYIRSALGLPTITVVHPSLYILPSS